MRSTRHLKNLSMGRNERVKYSRPSRTRARPLLAPVVRSCPRGAPNPPATRARSLFLLVCYSYSPATRARGVLATPSWRSTSTPATPTWRSTSTPRARALPGVRAPPGTGTTRGANPGYPCVARPPTRPCARARDCPYNEDRGPKTHQNPRLGSSLTRA